MAPNIEASPRSLASAAASERGFRIGERVFHIKFGYGNITKVEGAKLTVAFQTGEKEVGETFVERAG
jgi:DNA helicase-2/ATP-dependent DNA helicase PcrA